MSRYVVAIAAVAAAGIIAAVVAYGDISYRMQDGKEISVVGRMACLPHERRLFSGPETQECAFGFRGGNGEHYVISNFEEISREEPLLNESVGSSRQFVVTGTFMYGKYRNYDVVRLIDAESAVDFDSILSGTDQ